MAQVRWHFDCAGVSRVGLWFGWLAHLQIGWFGWDREDCAGAPHSIARSDPDDSELLQG